MNRSPESELSRAGQNLAQKTEELADAAAVKARQTAHEVDETLGAAAESIQAKIRKTGKDAADVVSSMTDRVRSSAHYVNEQGFDGLMDDLGTLIKRYPIQAVLIGVGVGFFLARGTRDD